ncbi:MAG: cell division protein FtsZ [Tannerellaceae bacterium]|jgi:cell division protein FtsZ|nr:cell division protein FtsZ [Tannerellaceae bacterium]
MNSTILDFDLPRDRAKIIKVIGVGGGGGNAVTHMYHEGIRDVSFLLCNTDKQALEESDVPDQLVLSVAITGGLGAGNNPRKARKAALDSEQEIKKKLSDGTKMVFITAGMGGGTGTGAAPVIARFSREMGILTVGIVTIPFEFEGRPKILQALRGVEVLRQNVDALLVINNERLLDVYADEDVETAFAKADNTLTVAAKSIAELITAPGKINVDFADVDTTLRNGGVALMSNGYGEGEGRFYIAAEEALKSPLLNNNDVYKAKKILFNISYSDEGKPLTKEIKEVEAFMSGFDKDNIKVIWGMSKDNTLGKKVKLTILATGFGMNDISSTPIDPNWGDFDDDDEEEWTEEKEAYMMGQYYDRSDKEHSFRHKIVVLSYDELDDDVMINLLEDNPTYKRDTKFSSRIRERALNEKSSVSGTSRNGSKGSSSNGKVFRFN